jgi:hypothetical protein
MSKMFRIFKLPADSQQATLFSNNSKIQNKRRQRNMSKGEHCALFFGPEHKSAVGLKRRVFLVAF